jgi:ketosteroid isomerase-like protein
VPATDNPEQNIALVRSLYAAFAARDVPQLLSMLSASVEWAEPANPFNPAGGTRHGHAGFLEWLRIGHEAEDVLLLEPRDFLANARSVAVVGRARCRVRATAREYATEFVHLVTLENGKVQRFQEFFDTYAAAEAFRTRRDGDDL